MHQQVNLAKNLTHWQVNLAKNLMHRQADTSKYPADWQPARPNDQLEIKQRNTEHWQADPSCLP